MMKWLNDALWAWCRIAGYALQLIGFAGLLLAALIGFYKFAEWVGTW